MESFKRRKRWTRGGGDDFFGNYLILNQSGMEKKSRNPKKISAAEDLEQPQPFIRSNRNLVVFSPFDAAQSENLGTKRVRP